MGNKRMRWNKGQGFYRGVLKLQASAQEAAVGIERSSGDTRRLFFNCLVTVLYTKMNPQVSQVYDNDVATFYDPNHLEIDIERCIQQVHVAIKQNQMDQYHGLDLAEAPVAVARMLGVTPLIRGICASIFSKCSLHDGATDVRNQLQRRGVFLSRNTLWQLWSDWQTDSFNFVLSPTATGCTAVVVEPLPELHITPIPDVGPFEAALPRGSSSRLEIAPAPRLTKLRGVLSHVTPTQDVASCQTSLRRGSYLRPRRLAASRQTKDQGKSIGNNPRAFRSKPVSSFYTSRSASDRPAWRPAG